MKMFNKKVVGLITACSLTASTFATSFYIAVDGKQEGPMDVEQIEKLKSEGKFDSDSMVWKDGMASWAKAGEQVELKALFQTAGGPPPMPVASTPPPLNDQTENPNSSYSQNDVNEINSMSDPKSVPTPNASDSVDDWSEIVLEKLGLDSFGENDGKFVLFAQQSVSLKPIDPQYGEAVINAFDKAMTKIQEKYIMNRFGKVVTDKLKSFYSDRSTNAKEIKLPPVSNPGFWGKVVLLLEKKLDIADKKLDKELVELGVKPETIAKATPTKKKDLFRDKFIKNTMKTASGSMSGLVPIQSTLIRDSKGNTVIGLVAIASSKTIQIAKDITLQRQSLVKGKGRDIKSLLPKTNKDYMSTMGVRLAYDYDGSPVIISYGMASYIPDSGDDYINDELKADARAEAIDNADAQIAEVVNGRMNAKSERTRGEETKKYVERELTLDSDTIEKTVKNIIKVSQREAKSSAKVGLQGISTVKQWRYTSNNGVKFVGAVRVWKYSTLAAVKSFNQNSYKKKDVESKKANSFKKFEQSSEIINDINDF